MKKLGIIGFALLLLSMGCRKKADPKPNQTDTIQKSTTVILSFNNKVGTEPLKMDGTWYKNENGDSFQVKLYKYYISNIVLTKEDGTAWAETESYHLIDQSKPESQNFILKNMPAGHYSKITFLIGVDAARNTSGAQTGALDPNNMMFWDWNSGYIMAKLEGVSPKSPNGGNQFFYHAGGYTGKNAVQRSVNLELPVQATIDSVSMLNVELISDVAEWFKTPKTISIADLSIVASAGEDAKTIADNYANMFSLGFVGKAVE